jgi:hypothetical protein
VHGFLNLRIFGSVAREEADRSSDIDFLVHAKRGTTLVDLADFQRDLEALLERKVDEITDGGISPYMKRRVLAEAIRL